MLYGQEIWDPALIVAKIVAVQCSFYLGLGVLMGMLVGTGKSCSVVDCYTQ